MIVFTTPRLVARHLHPQDVESLFAVCGAAEVMQWVGDGMPLTREECDRWIVISQQNYESRGFGNFALAERETGEFVGYGGVVYGQDLPDAEIIYALARRHWHKGYATELVPELLDFALGPCGLSRVVATIAPENAVSRHIVERAGMEFQNEMLDQDGLPMRVYVATRPNKPRER